jgi:hypothetical protein
MILGGFYPLTLLKNGTKRQCIDKAKELLDILAPGGNYFFTFDKGALTLNDINPENYVSVMEYVIENSKYSNAGSRLRLLRKKTVSGNSRIFILIFIRNTSSVLMISSKIILRWTARSNHSCEPLTTATPAK